MATPTGDKIEKKNHKMEKQKSKNSLKNVASCTEEKCTNIKFKKGKEKSDLPKFKKPFGKKHVNRTFKTDQSSKYHTSKELRVPKMYKQAARILQDVDEKKASVKNLVFSVRRDIRKIYAIVLQSLKYKNVILRLTNKSRLFQKEKHLDPYLARVLIYDMMFGRKFLIGDSRPVQTVLKHRGDISRALRRIMVQSSVKSAEELLDKESIAAHTVPRYARINTLLTTTAKVIEELEDKSFHQQQHEQGITQDEFYNLIKNLEKGQFMQDINFSDLLLFSQRENLSQTELYKNGHIILEDKTSYLAAKALAPPEGSIVLDGCAAPGIKTTHLAALMNNKGKIFACDINEKRMGMLNEMIQFTGIKCSSTIFKDFTCIDPNDEQYSSIEYILLDPSCSGSGMVSRLDSLTDDKNSKCCDRIKKLSAFQTILLKHALSFQNVKRIVYSTCSINVEENEEVVKDALGGWEETYKVVNAFPDWPTRGKEEYEFGSLCLRAYPNINYTNGFFIAVIERIEGSKKAKKKKKAKNTIESEKSIFTPSHDNEASRSHGIEVIAQDTEINESKHKSHQEKSIDNSSKKSKKKEKKLKLGLNADVAPFTTTDPKHCKEIESTKKSKKSKNTAHVGNKEFISAEFSLLSHKTDISQSGTNLSIQKRKINETEHESNTKDFDKKHKKKRKKTEK